MAKDPYPSLELGTESGAKPTRLRSGGRNVTLVGAILDGDQAYFDNGILSGKSKVEEGVKFGPEVLRAMGGRRVVGLWLSSVCDEEGRAGWFGLTAGEMRIDTAKKDGFRDVTSFQTKLQEAAKGRVAVWQLKDPEKRQVLELLRPHPDLWKYAVRGFRDTFTNNVPEAVSLDEAVAGNGDAPASMEGSPPVEVDSLGGHPARTMRCFGKDVTLVGAVIDGGPAVWDNGLLASRARFEEGLEYGTEPLRALGGRRVVGVWIAAARDEDGTPAFVGATVSEMRVDSGKKQAFADLGSRGLKGNDAARGRVEVRRLKPEERQSLAALLQGKKELWEASEDDFREAFET